MSLSPLCTDAAQRFFAQSSRTPPDSKPVPAKGKGGVPAGDKPAETTQKQGSLLRTAAKITLIAVGLAAAGYVAYRVYNSLGAVAPEVPDVPNRLRHLSYEEREKLTAKLDQICTDTVKTWCRNTEKGPLCFKDYGGIINDVSFQTDQSWDDIVCPVIVSDPNMVSNPPQSRTGDMAWPCFWDNAEKVTTEIRNGTLTLREQAALTGHRTHWKLGENQVQFKVHVSPRLPKGQIPTCVP